MRFVVLGSGSGGNAVLVESGETRVLLDAGFSARELERRLRAAGVDPASLGAVLLTHEHGDHCRALNIFAHRFPAVPVLTTAATHRVLLPSHPRVQTWGRLVRGQAFTLGSLEIHPFPVTHDAVEPVGFVVSSGHHAFGLLTDAGYPAPAVLTTLRGVTALVVEANYCEELLAADLKRPWSVKSRISGRHGHLSNDQAGTLVADLAHHGLRTAVLAHLSRDCNEPARALRGVRRALSAAALPPLRLHCAQQDVSSGWIAVEPRRALSLAVPAAADSLETTPEVGNRREAAHAGR